jgi:hypothetical protein
MGEALDAIGDDPAATPAQVVKLGTQVDYQGIIASSADKVGKAIGYLAMSIADTYGDDEITPAQVMHLDRPHREVRWLPCSPTCSNWLRFGVPPLGAEAGMRPGWCGSKAHDRHHLGLGWAPGAGVASVDRQDPRRAQGRPGRKWFGRPWQLLASRWPTPTAASAGEPNTSKPNALDPTPDC